MAKYHFFKSFKAGACLSILKSSSYDYLKENKIYDQCMVNDSKGKKLLFILARNHEGKAVPLHAMEALGGRGHIALTHSRPRHYMGVSGQRYAPAALLPPGKESLVPMVQEAGWAPKPVWTQRSEKKSFTPAGDRPVVRPLVRHYTA
jgi:hypothetical protein